MVKRCRLRKTAQAGQGMNRFITIILGALWAFTAVPAGAQDAVALARFDAARSTVEDVRGGAHLSLALSQGVPYRVFTLTEPNRLIVDFREVDWQGADAAVLDQSDRVRELRMGAYRAGWSRLVAVLGGPLAVQTAGLSIAQTDGTARLDIVLSSVDQAEFEATAGAPRDPRWDLPEPAQVPQIAPRDDPNRPLVVVIDPGHGGIDPGAENGSTKEADLMLSMARQLREALIRAGGYQVVLTREADVFVSLEARIAIAHQVQADLFVSLHADALAKGFASGSTVYTLSDDASDAASSLLAERHNRDDLLSGVDLAGADDEVAGILMDIARLDNTPRSRALAAHLVKGIEKSTGRLHKRPLRQAGFSVLKAADIPSVLVEVGFLSSREELNNLRDPVWRATMAEGLLNGIATWALEDAALSRLRRK